VTVLPLFAPYAVVGAQGWIGLIAEVTDELVVFVEDCDSPREVWDHEVFAVRHYIARASEHAFDDSLVFAVEVEDLEAPILSICDDHDCFIAAVIYIEPVGSSELARLGPIAAE
jgi:hypothetical protein